MTNSFYELQRKKFTVFQRNWTKMIEFVVYFFLLCNQNLIFKNEFTRPNSALFITAYIVEDCYDYALMAQGNHNILLIKL
jgi:hypothetical protein